MREAYAGASPGLKHRKAKAGVEQELAELPRHATLEENGHVEAMRLYV
jgi:hypothetical protein